MVSKGYLRKVYNEIQKINKSKDQILDSTEAIIEELRRLSECGFDDDINEEFLNAADEIEESYQPDVTYNIEALVDFANSIL